MNDTRLSIRLDLSDDDRIGPGKIALLEAIRTTGSISASARLTGMSYRRAWNLVDEINAALEQPAVAAATGGKHGGGAALTPVGEEIVAIYRSIEHIAHDSVKDKTRALNRLARRRRKSG